VISYSLASLLTITLRPGVQFFCDIDSDPFLLMQDQKKVYGFTLSLYEYLATIPTLWDATKGMKFIPYVPQISLNYF
jgi:alpha 1,2-mannosyltransferase